jgi:hypothetical protein
VARLYCLLFPLNLLSELYSCWREGEGLVGVRAWVGEIVEAS